MSKEYREAILPEMMEWEGEEADFVIERDTIEPGKTFSLEAVERMNDNLIVFVGTRIMRRWDTTQEPPTALTVTIKVVAS